MAEEGAADEAGEGAYFHQHFDRIEARGKVGDGEAEEGVERRTLLLDDKNEFHYHGRELIAEGRGGV